MEKEVLDGWYRISNPKIIPGEMPPRSIINFDRASLKIIMDQLYDAKGWEKPE